MSTSSFSLIIAMMLIKKLPFARVDRGIINIHRKGNVADDMTSL